MYAAAEARLHTFTPNTAPALPTFYLNFNEKHISKAFLRFSPYVSIVLVFKTLDSNYQNLLSDFVCVVYPLCFYCDCFFSNAWALRLKYI